jgi:hypothetical protein
MTRSLRWALFCAAFCGLQAVSPPRAGAQATFWDWFHGRTPSYQPGAEYTQSTPPAANTPAAVQPVGYTTTVSAPCACGNNATAPVAAAPVNAVPMTTMPSLPTTGYSTPSFAPAAGCSTCGPQPAFAATSPVAASYGYAPFSGCNTCGMASSVAATPTYAPTIRYRTTLARVPVTYYRPIIANDPGTGCPVTTLQPCTTYRWQFRRVPTTVNYRGGSSCWLWPWSNPDPPVASAPAFAPACAPACAPTISGVPTYGAAVSQPAAIPSAAAPYYPAPATLAPGPASSVPADNPPSLQPQAAPAAGQGSAYRLPSEGTQSVLDPPAPPITPPTVGTETTGDASRGSVDPATLHQPTFVKPLPDPEAPPLEAPQLLTPRDRTAARDQRGAVPVSWSAAQVQLAPAPAPPAAPVRWDDSGWRSEQPR